MIRTRKSLMPVWVACAALISINAARGETTAPPPGNASAEKESSVETFFQVSPTVRNSAQNVLILPGTATNNIDRKNQGVAHSVYRCVWHIMDDAGVPMFFGHDAYIDPSIKGTYLIPSPKLPGEKAIAKELEKSTSVQVQEKSPSAPSAAPTTPTNVEVVPMKIPESELEGVPLPTPK